MILRLSKAIFFLLLFLNGGIILKAQDYQVKGRVVDADSREALAFVNILVNNGPAGGSTDIDGKFSISSKYSPGSLRISYVGYEPQLVSLDPSVKDVLIRLKKKEFELAEIVIKPGINPAHRIIRSVLENRPLNDHERMESFSYTTYEKTTFGPDTDSIPFTDSLVSDTAFMRMKKFFDRQHLFLMESVTERRFLYPDKNYNKVVASRVSGFGDPLFVFLMSQVQSTSFYDEVIRISDKEYINPVSGGTFSKYYFEIRDTLIESYPYDTTFIISFRPLLNTNFDGLKGTLSVSTNNYAIRNVIAQPARMDGAFTVKIQQLYDFVQNSHWFPVQLNTDIIFMNAIGKGNVAIGVGGSSRDSTRSDLVGRGKSYISGIRLNPEMNRSQFGFVEVDVLPDAYHKSEELWSRYRVDSLTDRDWRTYHIIDSIGKAEKFDRMGYKLDAIINGKIPLGLIDLQLSRIATLNRYEGLRLGAGLETNDRVSEIFRLGGYAAYGFRDKGLKYGGNAGITIDRFHESRLNILFDDDINEAGADDPFENNNSVINPEKYRLFQVRNMDHAIRQQVSVGSRMFNFARVEALFTRMYVKPLYEYQYVTREQEGVRIKSSEFLTTEASLLIRYAYGEKFLKNTRSLISLGTKYPVVWIGFGHGFNGLSGGQFEYNRLDVKVQKTVSFKYWGKTSITVRAGIIDRDVPYPNLYAGRGDYNSFSLYSPNSFATMRLAEFVADRYTAVYLSHNFGKLLFRSKHFNPQPEILTNIGFGGLRAPGNHEGMDMKTYDKGYFESGIVLNNLLNAGFTGLGFGSFYRYGPYAFPSWKDNVALKLSVSFSF